MVQKTAPLPKQKRRFYIIYNIIYCLRYLILLIHTVVRSLFGDVDIMRMALF